jgi:hypothetical protein
MMSLTPEELNAKVRGAKAAGTPIFFTEEELHWLGNLLLEFTDQMDQTP